MPSLEELYERLTRAANLESDDAAIRIRAIYEPSGGPHAKVSPPTYPPEGERQSYYLTEQRWSDDGSSRNVVLLDSRQSQANRCEEALQAAIDEGLLSLPHLVLNVTTHGRAVRITSLTAPHRSRDAYFRDAEDEAGTWFDETPAGRALRDVTPEDAIALYRYSPTDLVFGVWDSHRDLRLAARFPRVYTSEVIGWDGTEGARAAGRFDLLTSGTQRVKVGTGSHDWQPDPANKGKRLSELGLGAIPPTTRDRAGRKTPGGVAVTTIERIAALTFPGLARIRIGRDASAQRAGRAVLGALALVGDRLAFGGAGVFLRSGCDLVRTSESMSWVGRDGLQEPLELDARDALALLQLAVERAAAAGLTWSTEPIRLRPRPNLQAAIDWAFFAAPDDAAEG